jgi:FdhD protein
MSFVNGEVYFTFGIARGRSQGYSVQVRQDSMQERRVERVDLADLGGGREMVTDQLVAEAPLELRAGGVPLIVIMRTPGHDRELARGLLFAEGIIDAGEPLADMAAPAGLAPDEQGNVLETGLPAGVHAPERSVPATAGCGVCGKRSIADLELRAAAVRAPWTVPGRVVAALPERLRQAQAVFEQTGGLHAAGLFDAAGTLLVVREDVGRHNAVDKVVGWALDSGSDSGGASGVEGGVALADCILCVSGRLGFEIVQKAAVAGIPVVVAVSAPSTLAVDLAERFRITLCGFTRGQRFNVYSHGSRIT